MTIPDPHTRPDPLEHAEGCPDRATGRITEACTCDQLKTALRLLTPSATPPPIDLDAAENRAAAFADQDSRITPDEVERLQQATRGTLPDGQTVWSHDPFAHYALDDTRDAVFLQLVREDVPALVAEVRRLRSQARAGLGGR